MKVREILKETSASQGRNISRSNQRRQKYKTFEDLEREFNRQSPNVSQPNDQKPDTQQRELEDLKKHIENFDRATKRRDM